MIPTDTFIFVLLSFIFRLAAKPIILNFENDKNNIVMTNFIPIFPLSLVVYPDEELKLHIFEPRYKQMIRECHEAQKDFGIPGVIDDDLKKYGTLMQVMAVEKQYENGEMDIRVRGRRVFRILEVIHHVPDKLYSGAIVHYPQNTLKGDPKLMKNIVTNIRTLHSLMNLSRDFKKPDEALKSYDVAHESGLNLNEEYDLLCLLHELQRQEYLRRHLKKVLPMLAGLENLKKRAKLNGEFRSLYSGKF